MSLVKFEVRHTQSSMEGNEINKSRFLWKYYTLQAHFYNVLYKNIEAEFVENQECWKAHIQMTIEIFLYTHKNNDDVRCLR